MVCPYVQATLMELHLAPNVLYGSLAGHNLTFFPGSSSVVCSMGITAATVICFDKVLGTYIARQASIKGPAWKDAAILLAGEQVNESLTCQCWMPNGDLLFGTSTGRILRAEGAALHLLPATLHTPIP